MSLLEGVVEVAQFLDIQHVPYAILGGIAVQHWGEPRTTLDIDVVVLVPPGSEDDFLRTVAKQFKPRLPDAVEFAKKHRILLISTSSGIPVDLSLGIEGYEEEALSRAIPVSFAGLPPVRVVSAEDHSQMHCGACPRHRRCRACPAEAKAKARHALHT